LWYAARYELADRQPHIVAHVEPNEVSDRQSHIVAYVGTNYQSNCFAYGKPHGFTHRKPNGVANVCSDNVHGLSDTCDGASHHNTNRLSHYCSNDIAN
jgi:hypothetical protein